MSAPTHPPAPAPLATVGFDPAFLGAPAPLPTTGRRSVVELAYTHSSVVLDISRALAACAAVNIDSAILIDLPRADAWQYDPRVPQDVQSGEEVYADNSLDRATWCADATPAGGRARSPRVRTWTPAATSTPPPRWRSSTSPRTCGWDWRPRWVHAGTGRGGPVLRVSTTTPMRGR